MNKRFFAPDSFWNTPLGEDVTVDPHTGDMLALLEQNSREGDRGFWLGFRQWTIPLYEVDENTPRKQVAERQAHYHHGVCFENPVPIPDHAVPDPEGDCHIAMVDYKARKAWDMWGVRKGEDGQWMSNTGMTYSLDGDGTFDTDELGIEPGASAHTKGPSRAAAVPAIAGLVTYDEVVAGEINHKLSFGTCANAYQLHAYPAAWTDGRYEGGIPEGCVIQLDPALDLSQFDLSPAALLIAKAMQKYGAVNVDNAGGKGLYVEGLYGQPDKSWDGILEESDLAAIGMSNYRILKPEKLINRGDCRNKGVLFY